MSGASDRKAAPAVSVLMTAYNRAAYIDAAIESVLAQTFTDFELIVVDDGSSDDTVARARAHAARDARVRVEVNPRNLGDYPNRNRAAALARGRFIKYHDSDDLMYPHCLETMVGALEPAPEAGFALTRSQAWQGAPCPMLLTPRMSYQREFLGSGMFGGGPACALFRSDVLRDLGGFEDVGAPSDVVFWAKACARVPVLLVPADLFWYRVHAGQEVQRPGVATQYARAAARVWQALNAGECPLDLPERETARRNHVFRVARAALADARAGRWSAAWDRLRLAGLSVGEWARYLRLPRRTAMAGTPLTADGEYAVRPATVKAAATESPAGASSRR